MKTSTFYHIYNHANGDENLFREEENYRFFLYKWSKHIEPVAESYAYCLMPNHFHFLIRVREEGFILNNKDLTGFQNLSGLLSQQFSNLFNSYSKAYNKKYERRGSLFNRPFKSKEINSDNYLTNIIFYLPVRQAGIHHNPVHHGFTQRLEDWKHSSYHALIGEKLTKLKRENVRDWFGNNYELKRFHQQAIKDLGTLELEFT